MFNVIFRTIFFYFFITLAYRIMGKREIGKLSIIDLIVSILIAELVAISIENENESIFLTILPIISLVVLELILGYLELNNKKVRVFFEGKPSLIICNGKINYHEMIKQRYTLDDLLLSLRQNEIKDIEEVEFAFLETSGKLSIFKYNIFKKKGIFPMPLIIDGYIEKDTLKYLKKDIKWLNKILLLNNINLNNIFYAFYKNKKIYFIKKSEL